MSIEGPTEADFAKLEADAAHYQSLDQAKLDQLWDEYHAKMPEQYEVAVNELDFADLTVMRELNHAVEADANLSNEEKYALKRELWERNRTAHMANAPDAWND